MKNKKLWLILIPILIICCVMTICVSLAVVSTTAFFRFFGSYETNGFNKITYSMPYSGKNDRILDYYISNKTQKVFVTSFSEMCTGDQQYSCPRKVTLFTLDFDGKLQKEITSYDFNETYMIYSSLYYNNESLYFFNYKDHATSNDYINEVFLVNQEESSVQKVERNSIPSDLNQIDSNSNSLVYKVGSNYDSNTGYTITLEETEGNPGDKALDSLFIRSESTRSKWEFKKENRWIKFESTNHSPGTGIDGNYITSNGRVILTLTNAVYVFVPQ